MENEMQLRFSRFGGRRELRVGWNCDEESYALKAAMYGELPCLVPVQVRQVDGKRELCFQAAGLKTLGERSAEKALTEEELLELFGRIGRAADELESYLLSPEGLLLKEGSIFLEDDIRGSGFCFIPKARFDAKEALAELVYGYMRRLKAGDERGISFGCCLLAAVSGGGELHELLDRAIERGGKWLTEPRERADERFGGGYACAESAAVGRIGAAQGAAQGAAASEAAFPMPIFGKSRESAELPGFCEEAGRPEQEHFSEIFGRRTKLIRDRLRRRRGIKASLAFEDAAGAGEESARADSGKERVFQGTARMETEDSMKRKSRAAGGAYPCAAGEETAEESRKLHAGGGRESAVSGSGRIEGKCGNESSERSGVCSGKEAEEGRLDNTAAVLAHDVGSHYRPGKEAEEGRMDNTGQLPEVPDAENAAGGGQEDDGLCLVPRAANGALNRIRATEEGVVIGRGGADEAVASPYVSRLHARLHSRRGRLYLTDLSSRNGTFVNAARIAGLKDVPLSEGDAVRFADAEYVVGHV